MYVHNISKPISFPKKWTMKKEILRYGSVHPMNPATALRFDGSKAGRGWKAIFPERLYPARVVVADHERGEERRSSVNRGESPEIGSHSILVSFFSSLSLSLSIERLFVPPFLSSPRSVRISSFIETQQVELGWFSKKLAEFIKPAHPVFIARPNLLAPNLDHSVFFFWEKILLEAVPCCGNVDRFFARRRDSRSSLFLFLKTTIITNLIANRWIERLVRIIDPPLSLVSSFLLCLYARRVLSMALYFFLFPSFSSMSFFYEEYFKVHDRGWGIRNLPELSSSVFKGGKGNACTRIHARWWSSRFVDFVPNNDRTLGDTASYIQTGAGSGLIVSGKKRKEKKEEKRTR